MTENQLKEDMRELMGFPSFRRFMFAVIQKARIFDPTTDGSVVRSLDYFEGRRNLGLELLEMAEQGQAAQHPEGMPLLTIMQVIREEITQAQATEKKNERPKHRTAELDDEPDDD